MMAEVLFPGVTSAEQASRVARADLSRKIKAGAAEAICGACGSNNLRPIDWAPPQVVKCSNCGCVQRLTPDKEG